MNAFDETCKSYLRLYDMERVLRYIKSAQLNMNKGKNEVTDQYLELAAQMIAQELQVEINNVKRLNAKNAKLS